MSGTHPIVQWLRADGPALSVGLVAADLMALGADVTRLELSGARVAHFDVMDGAYVPALTVGPAFIKAVRTAMLKDVHLMVREPLGSLADYVAAGADIVTIHPDACTHPHRVLQHLGTMANAHNPGLGIARGIALNPGVPLDAIDPLLDQVELIMVLAINPGWGGQTIVPGTHDRLAGVRERITASGRDVLVAVDGGITRQNIEQFAGLGVDLVVTGSAVFDGDIPANVAEMTRALRG